ncbi:MULTISPECIES: hypothetical protein [unclassified Sphingomonas]|uniref:hypothetical protein n=1 Tax=unclassified Sphingomonas TaxID=196159 RepID=UPI0035A91E3C
MSESKALFLETTLICPLTTAMTAPGIGNNSIALSGANGASTLTTVPLPVTAAAGRSGVTLDR